MSATSSSIGIVAYMALFATVGIVFLLANLLVGRLLRPANPHEEKLEIYECGEPTIGSSFVQFDLRFYVVALLFIIFDVEVAFFFPWATVFGKATNLADPALAVVERRADDALVLTGGAEGLFRELGVREPAVPAARPEFLATQYDAEFPSQSAMTAESSTLIIREGAQRLAYLVMLDIAAFFGVLMIGFLYVWKRGDLDWVRALGRERAVQREQRSADQRADAEAVLSL